jgi:PKD repeat protein
MLFRDVVSNIALGRENKNVLAFYIKRISEDQSTRVITAVLAIIMVAFQSVTFIAPPKVSEASAGSQNDIVYGGFRITDDLLKKYDSNPELRAIYNHVRIDRASIERMRMGKVNSDWNVMSMGRTQHGDPSQNIRLNIAGAQTAVYLRPLRVWGSGKWFYGLEGTNMDGARIWILSDCGNPVIEITNNPGQKETPPPTPTTPPPPTPTTPPPPTPTTPPPPQASYQCDSLAAYIDTNNPKLNPPLTVTFVATGQVVNTQLKNYIYDFGDGKTLKTTDRQVEHTYAKTGTYTARLRIETSAGTTAISQVCSQQIRVDDAKLTYNKQAVNLSVKDKAGNPIQASGTIAQSGNEIRYSISATNTGTGVIEDFVFEESIADIVEYADIIDKGGAKLVEKPIPGQEDKLVERTLVWDKLDIKANETVTKQFVVKVKSPIPVTPTGASDRNSYDLKMENIFFGNRVEILLEQPPVKKVEQVTQTLPQTGADVATTGMALFVSGMVFILLRNRLIKRELEILAVTNGGKNHV